MKIRVTTYFVKISALFLLSSLLALEGSSQIALKSTQANGTPAAIAGRLQAIAANGELADLRWPNFPDYRQSTQELYKAVNYAPVWVRDGQASPQALAVIAELVSSQKRGLIPEDYDGSRNGRRRPSAQP